MEVRKNHKRKHRKYHKNGRT